MGREGGREGHRDGGIRWKKKGEDEEKECEAVKVKWG